MSETTTKTMTRDEAEALVGDDTATFTSYFKYAFAFHSDVDEYEAWVSVGGTADEIYRYAVMPHSEEGIAEAIDEGHFVKVTRKSDGAEFVQVAW